MGRVTPPIYTLDRDDRVAAIVYRLAQERIPGSAGDRRDIVYGVEVPQSISQSSHTSQTVTSDTHLYLSTDREGTSSGVFLGTNYGQAVGGTLSDSTDFDDTCAFQSDQEELL
jgi:hypothetical protein